MKKFPIICPKGSRVVVTQGFMPIYNPSHDAIDFVLWDDKLTEKENSRLSYGSQFVAPVNAKCVLVNNFGTMNELGNGVDIEWEEGGYFWRLHFWHTSSNLIKLNDNVKEGQVIAYMGNTGDCRPLPTPFKPYDGTHCHLRLSRYQKTQWGNINITSLDVRDYFDIKNTYTGVDDSNVNIDLEPLKWAWLKLGIIDNTGRLAYMFKNIFS